MDYDSREETKKHIGEVEILIVAMIMPELLRRARVHDASKLMPPEKEMFDKYTPKLRTLTYGSQEYKDILAEMNDTALKHHYEANSHHPEHYENGLNGMSLLDLVEMFCDWWAATTRHADANMMKSIEHNHGRFGLSAQLYEIFKNTAIELGLEDKP